MNTLSVLLKVDNSFGSLFNGSRERQERKNIYIKEIKKERLERRKENKKGSNEWIKERKKEPKKIKKEMNGKRVFLGSF